MPSAPTRKPVAQKQAETNIALRGPLFSTQVPATAADRPSITIAMLKMMPIAVWLDVEVRDERVLVDAGGVRLADAQVHGQRRRRDRATG